MISNSLRTNRDGRVGAHGGVVPAGSVRRCGREWLSLVSGRHHRCQAAEPLRTSTSWVCHDLATRSLARSMWRSRNHTSDDGRWCERARKWTMAARTASADDGQGLLPPGHCLPSLATRIVLTSVCEMSIRSTDRDSQDTLITLIHTKYNPPRVCVAPHRSITLARRWRVDNHTRALSATGTDQRLTLSHAVSRSNCLLVEVDLFSRFQTILSMELLANRL